MSPRPENFPSQRYEPFDHLVENRWISIAPSAEIVELSGLLPNLYQQEDDYFTAASPMSLIGTMFLRADTRHNWKTYSEHLGEDFQYHEVDKVTGIPVYVPFSDAPTGLRTEMTIINDSFDDEVAGIVIQGPLAGLILEERPGLSPREGMNARRLWSDDKSSKYDWPDTRRMKFFQGIEDPKVRSLLQQHYAVFFKNFLRNIETGRFYSQGLIPREVDLSFEEKIKNIPEADLWLSKIFIRLCESSLFREVTGRGFHLTRNPLDMGIVAV